VNSCYIHNFPYTDKAASKKQAARREVSNQRKRRKIDPDLESECLRQANIESIKLSDLDGRGNIWTMSPPCQPFTTTDAAKQLGGDDKRNKAFNYLMTILGKLSKPPQWIFFENVKGFEGTPVHERWLKVLKEAGYVWKQYKISPLDVNIPMNRTRFYMICCREDLAKGLKGFTNGDTVYSTIPECSCSESMPFDGFQLKKVSNQEDDDNNISGPSNALPLENFVLSKDTIGAEEYEALIVPDKILAKPWAEGLSVVGVDDRVTFCFTSSYGQRMHKSSGSLLHTEENKGKLVKRGMDMSKYHSGKIRLFSPKELLRLFGFPDWYSFPPELKQRHRWKVVGQSISCTVVKNIMHAEFCNVFDTLNCQLAG